MIDSTDLAYAAGYTDGDGCFHIGKYFSENRSRFRKMFIINSVSKQLVYWFQKTFGGDISFPPKPKEAHKQLFRFVLKGKALTSIDGIRPFLVEKVEEFDLFYNFSSGPIEERGDFVDKMKFLKKETGLIKKSLKQEITPQRNTIEPSQEDFAYLAGFIDAECCLGIQRYLKKEGNPIYKILLQCNNSKFPVFFWLMKRFGGQVHFVDRSNFSTPHRNQMTWRLCSSSLLSVLEKIHPFLKSKKPVCENLMEFQKTTLPKTGCPSRNSLKFAEFYKPILDEKDRLFHFNQALNKKGVSI